MRAPAAAGSLPRSAVPQGRSGRLPPRCGSSSVGSAAAASAAPSGLGLLQASRPLAGARKGLGGCKNPTKPVPLRRLPTSPGDLLVELTTAAAPFPACALPEQRELPQELAPLLALDTLQPLTLVLRLCQVEHQLGALPEAQRRAASGHPSLVGFLERSLELVAQRGMGPSAPVLLLRTLSLLRFGRRDQLRQAYAALHRHVVTVLEDACKREPAALTPQAVLECYEAWAAMDLAVAPLKSSLVSLKLRECLRGSKFSPQECARLLVALAAIRRKGPPGGFSPCNYDVSDLVSGLVWGIRRLGEAQLLAAAEACSEFDWPLYRSPIWALDCVAQEAVRRLHTQAMPLAAADHLLRAAVGAAAALRPRLGQELEERVAAWELQALASSVTLAAAQGMSSWAEAEEAASALNNVLAFSLAEHGLAMSELEGAAPAQQ